MGPSPTAVLKKREDIKKPIFMRITRIKNEAKRYAIKIFLQSMQHNLQKRSSQEKNIFIIAPEGTMDGIITVIATIMTSEDIGAIKRDKQVVAIKIGEISKVQRAVHVGVDQLEEENRWNF